MSIELFINDYLSDQSISLVLSNVNQGYLKVKQRVDGKFVPLADVLGQDISQRLPEEKKWHGLLTDFQMLLHNCEVNQRRTERGQPIISGFWFWGEALANENAKFNQHNADYFYTDELSLAGLLGNKTNLAVLSSRFDINDFSKDFADEDICIHVSELEEAFIQNDMEGWTELYHHWINNWLLPAFSSVDANKLTSIRLITGDGNQYHYNTYSKWCFWRNNSILMSKSS